MLLAHAKGLSRRNYPAKRMNKEKEYRKEFRQEEHARGELMAR